MLSRLDRDDREMIRGIIEGFVGFGGFGILIFMMTVIGG